MKRFFICFATLLLMVSLIGCAQKQVGAPPEQPAVQPSETNQKAPQSVTEKQPTVKQEGMSAAEKELGTKIEDIHFAFDKYDLDDAAKTTLKGLSAMLGKMDAKVVIEGNCDERGTKEYNLALGDRRANAAKQYLISLGIPSAKIETISYGKEKPLCSDSTEECWAKNRRDHFVMVEGGK
ncbi:MAG TPA: peptidoglycan-associated lipoprotein Pal [Dissulfurispiraceae bacterium]|nr:peptidoglycan-associated lipoprotein Pal [Dissulfurispiraceae bacterium]